jgi:hypothetical protein
MLDKLKGLVEKYETWLFVAALLLIADMYNSSL